MLLAEGQIVVGNLEKLTSGEIKVSDEERQRMFLANSQRIIQIGVECQAIAAAADPEGAGKRWEAELQDALANPPELSADEHLEEAIQINRQGPDLSREAKIDIYFEQNRELGWTREDAARYVDGTNNHATAEQIAEQKVAHAVDVALDRRRRAQVLEEHRRRHEQDSRTAIRDDHQRRPSATIIRPMARRRGAGAPGGPRRRVAAATGGSSDDSSGSSDEPAPIGARAGELADQLISGTLDALRQDHRADLTAHVATELPRHALATALVLVRDELAEQGISWRWAPVEPEDGDDRLRIFAFAERTGQ